MLMDAKIICMSHLSDVQELNSFTFGENDHERTEEIQLRLNFVKYIMLETKGDLTKEIDADKMYKEFLEKRN